MGAVTDAFGTPAYVEHVCIKVDKVYGAKRIRANGTGGKPHFFKDAQTRNAQDEIAWKYKQQRKRDMSATICGIVITICVTRELVKSDAKKLLGSFDLRKPDVDNIEKLVFDSLNGIAFPDDRMIMEARTIKARRTAHGTGNYIDIEVRYYRD